MNNALQNAQQLVVEHMPLSGTHIIEASAGTGKTYNITRIYLRLLLEQGLSVEQILVMTFTNDATEEIRGRIDQTIRDSLENWSQLVEQDPFYQELAQRVDNEQVEHRLNKALLLLDEASIFTIHSFCQRVLTQHAFSTGVNFGAQLEADLSELVLEAVRDWYRRLALVDENAFSLVASFWPTPEHYVAAFGALINTELDIALDSEQQLIDNFTQQVNAAFNGLIDNKSFLFSHLVDGKKTDVINQRSEEFTQLIAWLECCKQDHQHSQQSMPHAFLDGKRLPRNAVKGEIIEIFAPVKALKDHASKLLENIERTKALALVKTSFGELSETIRKQKQQRNVLAFDDLIETLAMCLTRESTQDKTPLTDILQAQYPFALVDEFQDTDPKQFAILKALYYRKTNSDLGLMMIGDPKQAIYGFRGGDIYTYLAARKSAKYTWLMDTNWRSSVAMVNGYNRLFYGAVLNQPSKPVFGQGIDYLPVNPSPNAINNAQHSIAEPALHFVHFDFQTDKAVPQTARSELANWCANKIAQLLSDKKHSIVASDIALLVRDSVEALDIKTALLAKGLSSVYLSERQNLWQSEQAKQLLALIKAILAPEDERLFSAAMANPLLGLTPETLYQLQQNELAWHEKKIAFNVLKEKWLSHGFIAMALSLMHQYMVFNGEGSERAITNILHLFELLQSMSQRLKLPHELVHWYEQQLNQQGQQDTELRLESESDLIRIVTQHGSKGLEYPVVFIPFATRHKDPLSFGGKKLDLVRYHNTQGQLQATMSPSDEELSIAAKEFYAETVRLFYVAVTRAERHCYVLTADFDKSYLSPLGQTCFWQADVNIVDNLSKLAGDHPNDISVEIAQSLQVNLESASQDVYADIEAAKFFGKIERDWWLSSFTALSHNSKNVGVSSPDRDLGQTVSQHVMLNTNALRFSLVKGAKTGNLLHDILENVEFNQPDWHQAMHWPLTRFDQLPEEQKPELVEWLQQVLETNLSPYTSPTALDGSFTLSQLAPQCCLKEVEFYYPMESASLFKLSQLLFRHQQEQMQAFGLTSAAHRLVFPNYHQLKGMMHGFIDLVFEYQGKYYLADYKSTHLGDDFNCYSQEAILSNIQHHHYDLQYFIYALALHRYLKSHLPNYDPTEHFGGVFYFYIRGMTSQKSDVKSGVFYTPLCASLLVELDSLFAGNVKQSNEVSNG